MGFTNTEAISILTDVMQGGYLGLLTSANDAGGYTEVSVEGYKRYQISKVTTNGRKCSNADLILMFEARSAGSAAYFGLFNSAETGKGALRFWGEITDGLSMSDGTVPVIRVGELKLEVLSS